MDGAARRGVLVSFVLFICACALAQAAAPAPAAPPADATKFTSSTQLVLVPVIVTGKHGEHIAGLTRDAFHIEEHGKQRTASVFEEVKTVAAGAQSHASDRAQSNFALDEGPSWRLTIVLMDTLNTPLFLRAHGQQRLIDFLAKSLQRDEPTVLLGLSDHGLRQLHPFTTDTAVLLDAVKQLQAPMGKDESGARSAAAVSQLGTNIVQSSSGPAAALAARLAAFMNNGERMANANQQRDSIRLTLLALKQIAHAYAAIPGRKTLIWAGGGFPFSIQDPRSFQRLGSDMMSAYQETWRALMAADVAVYTVDLGELSVGADGTARGSFDASHTSDPARYQRGGRGGGGRSPYDSVDQKQDSMRSFAEATGGLACVNSNDLEGCFRSAVQDSQQYYLLGYYLPSDDMQPGWRKLKVKVDAEGAHARWREGFYVAEPEENSAAAAQRQLTDALLSPLDFTGLRINVRETAVSVTTKPAAAGKSWHQFDVGVLGGSLKLNGPDGNAIDLAVLTVAVDAAEKNAGQTDFKFATKLQPETLAKVRKTGLSISQLLELAPGKYDLRVAVRDNLSGAVGTIRYSVTVQ